MKKKYIVLTGLFLAISMLVATSLISTAVNMNGPFSIIPGSAQCDARTSIGGTEKVCDFREHPEEWQGCCNDLQMLAIACAANDGRNCYVKDHYLGDCCWDYD